MSFLIIDLFFSPIETLFFKEYQAAYSELFNTNLKWVRKKNTSSAPPNQSQLQLGRGIEEFIFFFGGGN